MSIVDEKYVSITTYRKNGTTVSSPVWIAALDATTAGFTTDATSGKVKRLRNDQRVTIRPCTMRGKVAPDAVEVAGTAVAVFGSEADRVEAAIVAKYGLMARVMLAGSAISRRVAKLRKKPIDDGCAVVITLG
jgi:uncharacterized protein